ncbi:glycosyltransferase [Longitalea luteola]|uniref:glycosyltransferase n=1 Tax=Longitalea luteola TaxID=2812563 RepID=UPI001A959130|nr:glycosyltransferase [Longitalea luteola]
MRVINIVDSVEQINYGIWHAVTANACLLANKNIITELWYPEKPFNAIPDVVNVPLTSLSLTGLKQEMANRKLDPEEDIIVTHGAWSYATRWGAGLKKQGFKWIYVPHGMLEPWPLQQKRIKKALYLHLIEKRLANHADCIKAVSMPESVNLRQFFKPSLIQFIPNGVRYDDAPPDFQGRRKPLRYLFLSRLHHKKNLVALATAWLQSGLNNKPEVEFVIAGPDEGELDKLNTLLLQSSNMKYIGSIYDEKKDQLFKRSTFYVLPSFSEGLPTSLLEAMSFGLVPIITEGCNLPEVFSQQLGVKVNTDLNSIQAALEATSQWDAQKIAETGSRARQFIKERFSLEAITNSQIALFSKLNMANSVNVIK